MRRLLFLLLVGTALAQPAAPGGVRLMNKGREGQVFNVTEYLVKGKTNIVEFTSPACPSCKAMDPLLTKLVEKNPSVVLNQLVVDRPNTGTGIDWQSPLCRQYELRSVPAFKIYDASGKLLAEGEPARKMVAKMLVEAKIL